MPKRSPVLSLSDALTVSDRDGLVALRSLLAASLVEADVPARAALSRELRAVLADLRALDAAADQDRRSVLDEIAARRAARRPVAEDRNGAAEGVVGRRRGG